MLTLPPMVRVFVARDHADMRKGHDGLSSLVIEVIEEDPQSGHIFVFFNRRRDRVKLLLWDGSGYWLFYKRIEHGRFPVFDQAGGTRGGFEIRASDLTLMLDGIDLRGAKRRRSHDDIHAQDSRCSA